VGGGGEPEEEGADEKHHGDAVHGASQRPRPRRLLPARRRQRVVRRQRIEETELEKKQFSPILPCFKEPQRTEET
jgi:hypothetical protein